MVSLILFIIILGTIVSIHEFGHFIFSKLFGVYVYEYSIGMGKKIWSKKPKNSETEYSIRIFPFGGFCRLAGEEGEDESDKDIPDDRKLYKKNFIERFLIFFMGPGFNFILALIVLLFVGIIFGGNIQTLEVGDIPHYYPAYEAGMRKGDTILSVNGEKVNTWIETRLIIATSDKGSKVKFKLKDKNNKTKVVVVSPKKEKIDGAVSYIYGVNCYNYSVKGISGGFKYMIYESKSIFLSMFSTIKYLFTGGVSVNDLSGPVGIYKVVDKESAAGISSLLYLLAYLSINVGVMNLLPFPAFDGGHILFLLIEKIRRKPLDSNIEATITGIGFVLIIILMIYVTFHDVLNLIH